jgi:outer membrane murein-binding lipoprotein Lpp
MTLFLDLAIALGAFLAAAYCLLLSRRLRALSQLDGDVGAAIAVLSQQVDALTRALQAASQSSTQAEASLALTIARAETATRNLELMLAAGRGPTLQPAPPETEGFAPFSRAGTRPRVLRQRDTDGGRP